MRSPARNRSEAQHTAFEEDRRATWNTPPPAVVQSTLPFAFAGLVNGGRYSQILQIMLFLNIVFSGQTTYCRAQSTVCRAIVELVIESCGEWRKNLPQHSVIAMDGSWSQRRNASHCVVHLIDFASGKIVDFEILEKPIGFSDGKYFHLSNGGEVQGVCRIVNLAIESCGKSRKKLPRHSLIAMDGSWSQLRNASHCVIHLIDVGSGKIVDFEILEKPMGFSDGNYFHSSNGVEVEAARRIVN
jgi:hypothetical protein